MDQYYDQCKDQQKGAQPDPGWRLIKSYWKKRLHFPAYLFLSIVGCMTIFLVGLDFIFNYWYYTYFYNALQAYNKEGLPRLFSFFFILSSCYLVLAIHRYWVTQLLTRRWLNFQDINYLFNKYNPFVHKNKKHLSLQNNITCLINGSLDFSMGLVVSITTFSAFMYYLCLLIEEIASHCGWANSNLYCIVVGLLTAILSTLYLIKKKYHLIPFTSHAFTSQGQNKANHCNNPASTTSNYLHLLQKKFTIVAAYWT